MAVETSPPVGAVPAAEAAEAVQGHEVPAGATEAAGHGGGQGGGLPQLEMEYWGGQIVWLLIIFAALYILLGKVFVPRLRKVLDLRAQTIAEAVNQAKQVQAEAEAQAQAAREDVERARAQSRSTVIEAKAKAAAELARQQAAEDERLAGEMATSEARIREMRDQAMTNVGTIARDTAQAMVAKLTGEAAKAAEIDAALAGRTPQGAA
jgi:F-type H+-transporting ATPase subunit b